MKKRLKAWVVLSLSAVLCAFLGLIGCSKQPEDESVDYSPVYGAYYCELDEGEEYRLVLSQGGYMWIAAGKTETGTYRYDGDKLYFTFADTQTETSATVENNILSVTYKGSAYRMYKEVGYTVSYVADGETTSANVINGKNAAKPSDPEKDGNLFVGWYSDEAYTKPYDFATPVTADVTLYACFTEGDVNDAEYTVTFISDGETLQTKQTIGGKAFDLPVPSSGDKTFVGWWVSDYQSSAKLTYKYGGEVLSADTDFYAVWAEDGYTSVSVNAEGVTWAPVGVNASYSVKVTAPDGSAAAPATVGSTTYAYDFASKAAGDYVVEVTVNGNTTTAYYKNKALARVNSFKVIEPSVLLFAPVENAQKYYVTVDCGEEGHNHIRVDNGSSVYFNFANCAMQPGGIKFTVEAAAAGYASSVAYYTVNRELQAATNLKIDAATDEVSWNAVENAAEYTVKITTANGTDVVNVGAVTKYSLKNYAAGTVTVEVTAQTKGYNSSEAASVSYTKTKIAAPSNIKVLNNVVTWDAVSGATAYKIKVGAVEKTVTAENAEATTVSFTLTNECYVNGFGTYAVSVKAVAATESDSSVYSEVLSVSYGDSVSAASYANGTVTWKPVANAAGYVVKVNGAAAVTVNDGAFSAAVTLTKSGVNVIDVYYIAENGGENKWASVETYAYSVIFDARGGAAVGTQYKSVGDPVTLPVTTSTGYDFAGWYTLPGGAANNGALYTDKAFLETTDLVLYAAWTPKDYTVQLDFGDVDAGDNATTAQVTYKRDYTVTMPVANSDATKAFAGWYSQPNAQGTRYTDQYGNSLAVWDYNENDRTFYAAWVTVFTFNEIESGNAYSVSKGKSIDLVSEVTVPVEYNGKPVTTVEGSAFQLCRNLVTVNIPDTVKLIETGTAFLSCSSLYSVNVYETGSNDTGAYTSVDGILIYDNVNNGVELKYFPQGRSGEVVIPDGVETLPVAVFKSSSITKVTIPASVTTINSNAFYYSRKLTQVVFEAPAAGGSANALTIDENAFRYCTALTSIDLPARLTAFNSNIFTQCSALAIVNVDGTGGA
ncbi:MAG: InlB B-repeat-containing protein, partial [Candidatus Scatosoma sp.]